MDQIEPFFGRLCCTISGSFKDLPNLGGDAAREIMEVAEVGMRFVFMSDVHGALLAVVEGATG